MFVKITVYLYLSSNSNVVLYHLSNRMLFVRVGNRSSAVVALSFGVPQGSVLGPILFTAYVAPIGKLIESLGVKYHTYADDTQLYTALTTSPDTTVDLLEVLFVRTSAMVMAERHTSQPRQVEGVPLRPPAETASRDKADVHRCSRMLRRSVRKTENPRRHARQ